MYGPLPVLHFGEARSPYDAQDVLYDHFFQTLNNSISVLEDFLATTPDSKALVKVDAVYGGDFAKWLKFARFAQTASGDAYPLCRAGPGPSICAGSH